MAGLRRAVHSPALVYLILVFAVAVLAPPLLGNRPFAVDLGIILESPSPAHPLGTDENGRDVLARQFGHY